MNFQGKQGVIIRIIAYIAVFLGLSGLLGPDIVKSKLLYEYFFFIYGNMGKLLLFSFVLFFVLAKDRVKDIKVFPFEKKQLLYLMLSFSLIPIFLWFKDLLLQTKSPWDNVNLLIMAHLTLVAIMALPLVAVFGEKFVYWFTTHFKKELQYCVAIGVVLYLAIFQVWRLWPYLADVVLGTVVWVFSLFFDIVRVGQNRTVLVQDFAVRIDQACSGIEGIFLFTVLYIVIGLTEWKNLRKGRFFALLIPAVLGMFFVNVFRVNVLILIGVLWSPQLALSLFHTYAGFIFFIIYFLIFIRIFMPWITRQKDMVH